VEIWFWAGLSILIGYLPFAQWTVQLLTGQDLKTLGTGNIGVSAAFHHGGVTAGILTVMLEIARSVGVVLVAHILTGQGVWESTCLVALIFGRNLGGGGGVTNTFWGGLVYSPLTVLGAVTSGGILFFLTRNRRWTRMYIYVSLPFWIYVMERNLSEVALAIVLSLLLGWMDRNMADDLDLEQGGNRGSKTVQSFLQGKTSDNRPKSL
jgi:glycerol-3-phosphate acyltransferase PlsY